MNLQQFNKILNRLEVGCVTYLNMQDGGNLCMECALKERKLIERTLTPNNINIRNSEFDQWRPVDESQATSQEEADEIICDHCHRSLVFA